ncbi:beta-lactamase/transpeptidase-like protein [Lophiotrema nucula]|uniref:Beta-lactamase/transpeptidase-like protein n=1 Tax=Lophiotrema nucula TaxID=690887 RepID=A0A6A5YFP1_9PLEO|nr:beta-lactamase/transpeptidase-like protein [Lophiotrema nucula]
MWVFSIFTVLLLLYVSQIARTEKVSFSPCPLLGPRFSIPSIVSASPIIQDGLQNLTKSFDEYALTLNGTFGPTSPNTTSFSVALFSTEETNSTKPYFYEYHHIAPSLRNATARAHRLDAHSVYRVGDLTTLFTVWLFLVEAGEEHLDDPVSMWVPELEAAVRNSSFISRVQWKEVTLGDLAAHLGGIGSYAPSLQILEMGSVLAGIDTFTDNSPCRRASVQCKINDFLSYFGTRPPVFAATSTPIFSNAGFIILGSALERITGRSYEDLLLTSILRPLNMSSTTLLQPSTNKNAVIPSNATIAGWSSSTPIEAPFNGLYSTIHDMSEALRAILSSALLPGSTTRRWLKPVSQTSNLVNSVGRPFEIYSLTASPTSPVIPIYQVRGNVDLYSSHIGLAPDYGVGFVIMAADSAANPDLNAYADLIATEMIPALEQNAIVQASQMFSGTYVDVNKNMTLVIAQAEDTSPGLSLTNFTAADKDLRAVYAKLNSIDPENLSFRLYPTDLIEDAAKGKRMTFRASFQDVTTLADAGTPTCDTWRYIDRLQINGVGIDEFIFEVESGNAVKVEIPAFDAKLEKQLGE